MRLLRQLTWHPGSRAPIAGAVVASLTAVAIGALPGSFTDTLHERTADTLLELAALLPSGLTPAASLRPRAHASDRVVVVDIDTSSLAAIGPWPWPRSRIAELVDAAARSGARSAAIDILFEGADARSPATPARRLGRLKARPDIVSWADTLEDGDHRLAEALDHIPVSLGFALDPDGASEVPVVPFLTSGNARFSGIWQTSGSVAPFTPLLERAGEVGALALAGDEDGMVRRVPPLVGVAGRTHPGLAAEAVRLAQGASAHEKAGRAVPGNTLPPGIADSDHDHQSQEYRQETVGVRAGPPQVANCLSHPPCGCRER